MPLNKRYLFFVIFILYLSGCKSLADRDILYQVSTIQALSAGDYDGQASLCSLKKHGDFGLGTFQGLDGEMVVLDGVFYQVKVDGRPYALEEAKQIPFAQLSFFDADEVFNVNKELSYADFKQYLDKLLASRNIFYAVKISGRFKYVKIRSVPKQPRPYPALDEAVKGQKVFELNDVYGTVVGWRSPEYSKNLSVGGYHLHFISRDKLNGGHLLDFLSCGVKVETDATPDFYLSLPINPEFLNLNLDKAEEKGAENE